MLRDGKTIQILLVLELGSECSEGKRLEIDTVSQNSLNAIKNH